MRSSEIQLRKLKLRLRDKRSANHKAPCTAIWQQPFQSVLALRGCSATDIIYIYFLISPSQDKIPGAPLSRSNIVASHLAGAGLIPGWDRFPGWGFFQGFSSTVRQMMGKLRHHQSPDIIDHQTLLFRAVPIDFTISSLHFVASFCCRLAWLGKNCFLHKQLLTQGLPIPSLVYKLNGNSVATTLYPPLV